MFVDITKKIIWNFSTGFDMLPVSGVSFFPGALLTGGFLIKPGNE
jgi:hypothetical protein